MLGKGGEQGETEQDHLTMIQYQWTSTFMGVLIAGVILFLVRRDHLHGPYAVWWLIVATSVAIVGTFPKIFDNIAPLVGIAYPPILAVVLGMGLLLVKILTMDLERSRQERKLRRLTQRLAILEANLQKVAEAKEVPASEKQEEFEKQGDILSTEKNRQEWP